MGVNSIIIICLVIALVACIVALAARPNKAETSQVARYEGRLDAIQRSMDTVHERLAGIEKTGKFLMKASVKEATPESEAEKKPLGIESVRTAIRFNGFTPEITDTHLDEWQTVKFKIGDTQFRVDTSRLPFLTLDLGYSLDQEKEDAALLERAAAEVTAGIFIGKAYVLGGGQAVVFNAEFLCDSYLSLRDNFKKYLDIVIETQKRFFETYNRLKEEKRRAQEDILSRMAPTAADGKQDGKVMS